MFEHGGNGNGDNGGSEPEVDAPEVDTPDISHPSDPNPEPGYTEYEPIGEPSEGDIYVPYTPGDCDGEW